jgi:hypothetical protein
VIITVGALRLDAASAQVWRGDEIRLSTASCAAQAFCSPAGSRPQPRARCGMGHRTRYRSASRGLHRYMENRSTFRRGRWGCSQDGLPAPATAAVEAAA